MISLRSTIMMVLCFVSISVELSKSSLCEHGMRSSRVPVKVGWWKEEEEFITSGKSVINIASRLRLGGGGGGR